MTERITIEKFLIILCLSVAIYITAICPCKTILSCHMRIFYFLIIMPALYIFIRNSNVITQILR